MTSTLSHVHAPKNFYNELVTCIVAQESFHLVSREKYVKDSSIKKISSSLPFLSSHALNLAQSPPYVSPIITMVALRTEGSSLALCFLGSHKASSHFLSSGERTSH
jgi:hypothetical protein